MEQINNLILIHANKDLPFECGRGYIVTLGVDFRLPDGYFVMFRDIPDHVINHDVHIHPSTALMFPSMSNEWKVIIKHDGEKNMIIKKGDPLLYAIVMKGEMSNVEVIQNEL